MMARHPEMITLLKGYQRTQSKGTGVVKREEGLQQTGRNLARMHVV